MNDNSEGQISQREEQKYWSARLNRWRSRMSNWLVNFSYIVTTENWLKCSVPCERTPDKSRMNIRPNIIFSQPNITLFFVSGISEQLNDTFLKLKHNFTLSVSQEYVNSLLWHHVWVCFESSNPIFNVWQYFWPPVLFKMSIHVVI